MIRGRNALNFLLLFLLFVLDVSSLGSYSRHYLGFGKLNQPLLRADNFPVAMVVTNCQSSQQKSFQQLSIQTSSETSFRNLCFHRKKLRRKPEEDTTRLPLTRRHSRTKEDCEEVMRSFCSESE